MDAFASSFFALQPENRLIEDIKQAAAAKVQML
jgi:hypothetical protein